MTEEEWARTPPAHRLTEGDARYVILRELSRGGGEGRRVVLRVRIVARRNLIPYGCAACGTVMQIRPDRGPPARCLCGGLHTLQRIRDDEVPR